MGKPLHLTIQSDVFVILGVTILSVSYTHLAGGADDLVHKRDRTLRFNPA